jgi:hypothetical protein
MAQAPPWTTIAGSCLKVFGLKYCTNFNRAVSNQRSVLSQSEKQIYTRRGNTENEEIDKIPSIADRVGLSALVK